MMEASVLPRDYDLGDTSCMRGSASKLAVGILVLIEQSSNYQQCIFLIKLYNRNNLKIHFERLMTLTSSLPGISNCHAVRTEKKSATGK